MIIWKGLIIKTSSLSDYERLWSSNPRTQQSNQSKLDKKIDRCPSYPKLSRQTWHQVTSDWRQLTSDWLRSPDKVDEAEGSITHLRFVWFPSNFVCPPPHKPPQKQGMSHTSLSSIFYPKFLSDVKPDEIQLEMNLNGFTTRRHTEASHNSTSDPNPWGSGLVRFLVMRKEIYNH
jgi:hypothetical protein